MGRKHPWRESALTRPAAALALCALLTAPSALAAALGPAGPAGPPPLVVAAPSFGGAAAGALRVPDEASLDAAPDLPVVPPPPARTPLAVPVNWTVLVYMVADNNLEAFAMQDLNEMEAPAGAAGVRVVVEVDRSAGYDTSNGDWTTTRRYLITHDNDASTVTSTLLADLGELNMGDPQTLADFLAWGVDTYPAQHYLVDLWDHGFGWSGGFGQDLGDNDHLSLVELSSALQAAASHLGRPFDIVAFDACLMQQVDVAYALAWVADYLVAAEELEPDAGFPYDEMLAPLLGDPAISPQALASALVDAYLGYYGLQGEVSMAASRLSTVRTGLADALNALALDLSARVEPPKSAAPSSVEQAVLDARDLSPKMQVNADYVDLGEFLRHLAEDTRLAAGTRALAGAARGALNSSLVNEGHALYHAGYSGMTAYLPASGVPTRYLATRFANESYWDEFLVALISGVPAGGAAPSVQVFAPSRDGQVARRFTASLGAAAAAGSGVLLEYKAGWGDFAVLKGGAAPLSLSTTLDAGLDAGPAVLSFRAVDLAGRPSPVDERTVTVVAPPVALSPLPAGVALAVNRTKSLSLNASPRAPFQSFDIAWSGLPPGVSGAGTTSSVALAPSPAPPFAIDVELSAAPAAAEGAYAVALAVSATVQPSVVTFWEFTLTLSRPLPDLAVTPLNLSDELPLPGENVTVRSNISNIGFDTAPQARVVALLVDGAGARSELANFTTGPLAPGDGLDLSVSFLATRGTQRVTVTALPEPALEELSLSNNMRERTLTVVNLSVALTGPPGPLDVALGPNATALPLVVHNLGIDPDRYALSILNLSNASWQAGVPFAFIDVPGRTTADLPVDILPPLAAEGADEVSFVVGAVSQADANVTAAFNASARVEEAFNASVRPQPNEVELSAGGAANVTVLVQNTGNGHESFALLIQSGDARLQATLDVSAFVLGPGAAASLRLALRDGGLVSTDRPYSLEVVAVSLTSGLRFAAIVSVHVDPAPRAAVEPLEPRLDAPASGFATFHARVRNTGNTVLLLALLASAVGAGPDVALSAAAAVLGPGASTVVNGTAAFAAPPLAGTYVVGVSAVNASLQVNATGTFELTVPPVHDLRAAVAPAVPPAVPPALPRTVVRTLVVENHGNIAEDVSLVVGYVPLAVNVTWEPGNGSLRVPPGGNASFTFSIRALTDAASSGDIPVTLTANGGATLLPAAVSFEFAGPEGSPLFAWLIIGIAAAVGVGLWVLVKRSRKPEA